MKTAKQIYTFFSADPGCLRLLSERGLPTEGRPRGLGTDAATHRLAFVRQRALRDERSQGFDARK